MSRPKIRVLAKAPSAAELAGWSDAQVEAEHQRLSDAWMVRSNSGQRQTWQQFEEMDVFFLELTRRKYGPKAALEEKAVAANFKMGLVPKGEN